MPKPHLAPASTNTADLQNRDGALKRHTPLSTALHVGIQEQVFLSATLGALKHQRARMRQALASALKRYACAPLGAKGQPETPRQSSALKRHWRLQAPPGALKRRHALGSFLDYCKV